MNELVQSMGLSIGIAFAVAAGGAGLWFLIDKKKRVEFAEKEKKKILSTREWSFIVFGILFIIQGSAVLTIFASSINTDLGASMSGIGMFLIIVGVLFEIQTNTNFKRKLLSLEKRLDELDKKD